MSKFTVDPSALYFTDNGAVLCADHLGMSARYSGRDISGQRIVKVTPFDVRQMDAMGVPCRCESCGAANASR
jgi:hypothetical protein